MSWKVDKIKDNVAILQREEARKFTVAYGDLAEKYWGFLSEYPQPTKVFFTTLTEEEEKGLKAIYGENFYKNKNNNLYYYKANIPYLGVDGCLAMMHDQYEAVNIEGDFIQLREVWHAKCTIKCGHRSADGIVKVPSEKGKDGKFSLNFEKAASSALRRALTFLGFGRFPLDKTVYQDHPQIVKYREFLREEANTAKSVKTEVTKN